MNSPAKHAIPIGMKCQYTRIWKEVWYPMRWRIPTGI